MNSTDLHIKYHMDTGEWHEWCERYTGKFHSMENYSREYAKWLEEQYLELFNNHIDQTEVIEKVEEELEEAYEKIDSLEEEISDLRGEIEFFNDQYAGEDY